MKKIVSLVMVIAILASFGAIFASAEKRATVNASGTEAVYADGDFVKGSLVFTVNDPDNPGKDWLGIYPVSKVADINNMSMAETIGWWTYLDSDNIELCAAVFKADWSKYEFEIGAEYYAILFDNDGYKMIDYVRFKVVAPAAATEAPKATEAPAEVTEAPAKATEAPKATEVPAKATEVPAKATEAPKATEVPAKATEVPAEATEAPAEVTEGPAEATEAPAEATEPPTDETAAPEVTNAPERIKIHSDVMGCRSTVSAGAVIILACCALAVRKKD